jgi:hypothetical protein
MIRTTLAALLLTLLAGCASTPRTFNVRDDSQRYAADGTPMPPVILDISEYAMKHHPYAVGSGLILTTQMERIDREYDVYVIRQQRIYENARTHWLDTLVVNPWYRPEAASREPASAPAATGGAFDLRQSGTPESMPPPTPSPQSQTSR